MNYYFVFHEGNILLTCEKGIPFGHTAPDVIVSGEDVTTITHGERVCHVIDARQIKESEDYRLHPLRSTYFFLSPEDYFLAGKCEELVHWNTRTRFCGICGGAMYWKEAISKQCAQCQQEIWPSPSPAMIVRVTREDKILLVKAKNFKRDFYGLVSGYVETGENLEECVRREVKEETGLEITDLQYFGSQAWPFPFGLMVGFTARYLSGTLQIQQSELLDAGWFTRDNLPSIPNEASIARKLIDDWASKT